MVRGGGDAGVSTNDAEMTHDAPGWPGIPPRWTSSAKSGVATALSATSRVWFTLSHGILDEIYYPRVDQACTRHPRTGDLFRQSFWLGYAPGVGSLRVRQIVSLTEGQARV